MPWIAHPHALLADINSSGKEIDDVRLFGMDDEHKQPSKTMNAEGQ
jgi:hypothetical protein